MPLKANQEVKHGNFPILEMGLRGFKTVSMDGCIIYGSDREDKQLLHIEFSLERCKCLSSRPEERCFPWYKLLYV